MHHAHARTHARTHTHTHTHTHTLTSQTKAILTNQEPGFGWHVHGLIRYIRIKEIRLTYK